jgi:hypothetical protein
MAGCECNQLVGSIAIYRRDDLMYGCENHHVCTGRAFVIPRSRHSARSSNRSFGQLLAQRFRKIAPQQGFAEKTAHTDCGQRFSKIRSGVAALCVISTVILLGVLGSTTVNASPSTQCTVRLIVELTPDIPDPHDAGFLSSLLSNHTDYQLTWVRRGSGFDSVLKLSGPGPEDRCRSVIETMLHDGRVLSIHPDMEDRASVLLLLGMKEPDEASKFRVSLLGPGSVLRAVSRPAPAGTYADFNAGCRITQLSTGDSTACP